MGYTFHVDLRGIVDLLSHHLYASPRVYVRELMQNAADAITARRLGTASFPLARAAAAASRTCCRRRTGRPRSPGQPTR